MMARRIGLFPLAAVVAFLLTSPAQAALVTLTGKVTDVNGLGIFGVQINFVDSCTGVTAGALNNTTSTSGSFQATVNAGVYDLEFFPPLGSLFTAKRIRNFDLRTSTTLAPVALPNGVVVSGHVTDSSGVPVSGVYLHFFPPGSSDRVYTIRDRTDLSGNYSVVVAAGTYDLRYGPPSATNYLALVVPSVSIPTSTTLPTVALQTGLAVSGTVTDSNGSPVIDVPVDAFDAVTGAELPLSHNRSDATGAYSVTVPPGTYYFEYKPPQCTLLVGQKSAATVVSADLTLPPVPLVLGVLVKGTVTDTRGTPAANVDTKYFGSSGVRVVTTDDHSDATGAYSAVVPPDTYSIEYAPPMGVRLAGVKTTGVVVSSNPTTLPTVQLPDGFFVTGRVVTVSGTPIDNVDLKVYIAGTITKIYVANHHTDVTGHFSIVVVPGSYDISFQPPTTNLAARRLFGINVSADVSLGDVVLQPGYVVTGTVTDTRGAPVVNGDLNFYDANTGAKADTPNDNTDLNGNYLVVVPAGVYNVDFAPPAGAPLETKRISGVSITANLSGLNAVLRDAFLVSGRVVNSASQPVSGVVLSFYQSSTGTPQVVSRNLTALDGTYAVYVPPGTYDILFAPPTATGLAPRWRRGVAVSTNVALPDTTLLPLTVPTVTSITPNSGPTTGGQSVTVSGTGFQPDATLSLGGVSATSVSVLSSTTLTAITPAHAAGVADVTVINPGNQVGTRAGAYTFLSSADTTPPAVSITAPLSGASVSGTITVSANASDNVGVAGVQFKLDGVNLGPEVSMAPYAVSWNTTTATSGSHILTAVARDAAGNRTTSSAVTVTVNNPTVTSITPNSGTTAGGQSVTISGKGFIAGITLRFGGVSANVVSVSDTALTAITPAHPAGLTDVTVTDPGNPAATLAAAYTFKEPTVPIVLTVTRSGNDIVLSWTSTGQSSYTVFGSNAPTGWTDASILSRPTSTTYTIVGGALSSGAQYYAVY